MKLKGIGISHLCSRFFSRLCIDLPITVLFSQLEMLTCVAFISGSLPRFLKWFVVIWDLPSFLSLLPGRKSGTDGKCLAIYRLSRCYVSCGYVEEAAYCLFTSRPPISQPEFLAMVLLLRIFFWFPLDIFFPQVSDIDHWGFIQPFLLIHALGSCFWTA